MTREGGDGELRRASFGERRDLVKREDNWRKERAFVWVLVLRKDRGERKQTEREMEAIRVRFGLGRLVRF